MNSKEFFQTVERMRAAQREYFRIRSGDTQEKALARLGEAWRAGFLPFAMLYRDKTGDFDKGWKRFQREWANRTIVPCNCKKYFEK